MMLYIMRLHMKRCSTDQQYLLNFCEIAKDLHLHGNIPTITDSLFYTSFFLYNVSHVKSHYVGYEFSRAMILKV